MIIVGRVGWLRYNNNCPERIALLYWRELWCAHWHILLPDRHAQGGKCSQWPNVSCVPSYHVPDTFVVRGSLAYLVYRLCKLALRSSSPALMTAMQPAMILARPTLPA